MTNGSATNRFGEWLSNWQTCMLKVSFVPVGTQISATIHWEWYGLLLAMINVNLEKVR